MYLPEGLEDSPLNQSNKFQEIKLVNEFEKLIFFVANSFQIMFALIQYS